MSSASRLRLSPLMLISDAARVGGDAFLRVLESCLDGGLAFLQIREPAWDDVKTREFLRRVLKVLLDRESSRCRIVVNRRPHLAAEFNLAGVHIGGGDVRDVERARRIVGSTKLVGYSAHSPEEILEAAHQGADYVCYSPIFGALSKRHVLAPVGLDALEGVCRGSPVGVYALGGVQPSHAASLREVGAVGGAMIGSLVDVPDPCVAVREFLRQWEGQGGGSTRSRDAGRA